MRRQVTAALGAVDVRGGVVVVAVVNVVVGFVFDSHNAYNCDGIFDFVAATF